MNTETVSSWGRTTFFEHEVIYATDRFLSPVTIFSGSNTLLGYGNGRSYGDSCLNEGGTLIKTRGLNRFIHFNSETGILTCEAGVLLSEILDIIVPHGWFLPITPGTRFVTVGGAIANDVHGKNHHHIGTFGSCVRRFELLRSDEIRYLCSPSEHRDYFAATIGGLGLTGLIIWAEIQLRRIHNPWMVTETIQYHSLEEFLSLCAESDQHYEYTVSWVDCSNLSSTVGRGLFMRSNHASSEQGSSKPYEPHTRIFPFTPPISLVNPLSLNIFNTLYYHKQHTKHTKTIQHYEPFFYPLDSLLEWNRLYGRKGFFQYQCVVPSTTDPYVMNAILKEIKRSEMGSMLAVLKVCGAISSPGLLSFPMPGISLALDFPNRGEKLHRLFSHLDHLVSEAGGRLYPAKDGRMPGTLFRSGYPQWKTFSQYIDPRFSSSFWRRVTK